MFAQLVVLLPSGILGYFVFWAPATVGLIWLLSPLVRRNVLPVEYVLFAAFCVFLLAVYVPLFIAEHRVIEKERERQRAFERGEPFLE